MKQSMTNITIYHNSKCSNSRGALALIREYGLEPEVIEYLKTPPSKETLKALITAAGITPRELLRTKEDIYAKLGLDDAKWTDDELVDFMLQHPVLINRPIVVTPLGTRLCRPPERVLEILPKG
jgi:arsenate reductase